MSDERKVSTTLKEDNKLSTTETINNKAADTVGVYTTTTTAVSTFTNETTPIVNNMSRNQSSNRRISTSSNQSPPGISGSTLDTMIESKSDDTHNTSTIPDLTFSLLNQPDVMPTFNISLADNEWDREDDDDDESDDESDDDLPDVMPGGMPLGGFMAMGDDDDDDDSDDLPIMVPGLVRQNGYYRSETSSDYMAEQRAA